MSEENKTGKDHLRESRKHLEKGTLKFLEQGGGKLEYYGENRSDLIQKFSKKLGNLKKPALSGTIVLTPIIVVLLVISWLFEKIGKIPGNNIFNVSQFFGLTGTAKFYVDQTFKLLMLLLFGAILVTGVGGFVKTDLGFKIEKLIDKFFGKIPFIGSLYNVSKVTTETVLAGAEDLSRPVKLDFQGMKVTGFKAGNTNPEGKEILFVPNSPNITTGFVLEVD